MDNKKRKISVEDDKGPAQAKRQKTEETEPGSEPAEHTNVNTEAKNFQSDKSRANSEPVTTEASIALKRSLLNSEELASSDGRSKETDAQQDENETNDELGVSASSTVIVTQDGTNSLLEIPLIPALPNTGQKSTCWTTTKSQLDEETEIGEPYQSENKQLSVLSKHGENTDAGISDGSVTSPLEKQAVNLRCNDTESEKTTTIDESDSILSTTHQLNVIENEVAKVDCPEPDRVTTASQPTQAEDNIDATQELDELRIGRETDRTDRVSPLGDILSPSEETFGTENEQQTSNGSNTEPTLLSVTVDPNDTDETHQVPAFPRNLDECSEHEKHIDGGIDINARDLILANAKAKALEEERIAEDKRSVLDASDNASCDLQESKPVSYSESVIHVQIADKRIETELKEINRQEVTHESTELPVVDVKPEKLEGENDEKLNDLVFPLPTIEAIAVEEHNIMSEKYNQEMASVSKTASLMDNAEITLQSTQSGESTENETQNVGKYIYWAN